MKRKNINWLIVLFLPLLFISACSKNDAGKDAVDSDKAQLVTSIYPVYEIVKEIAGDQAEVHLMVGSGEDAHHYEPSAKAITLVNEADAFIYSGDEMEFWASDMLEVVENENLSTVRLADGIDLEIDHEEIEEEEVDEHGHDHGKLDPHFWLNPLAISQELPTLADLFSEIDPAGSEQYEENAEKFMSQLESLDQEFQESFQGAENRSFVVQHKAFGHLANRYNLEQLSVGGLSTEVEPNPRDLIEVIQFVEDHKIDVIFYQSGNTSAVAETIARETGAEISILYDIENKPEGLEEAGNGYIEAMYHNLEALKKTIH